MFQLWKKKVKDYFFFARYSGFEYFTIAFYLFYSLKLYKNQKYIKAHVSQPCQYLYQMVPNTFFLIYHANSILSEQIALPDMNVAGMENWGLITYQEEILLYGENISNQFQKHKIAKIIAHEMAHQVSA